MRANRQHPKRILGALAFVLWACGTPALGQVSSRAGPEPRSKSGERSLSERQELVRDRLQRLESRMLKLSGLLAESQPGQAERLRDALEYAGSRRIKARVARLTELLRSERLSEAEREQESLLADLDALLTLLTSSTNEVERRRAQRERLEALKRSIRTLLDEQTQILYRTRHVEQRWQPADSPQAAVADDVAEMLHQLERLQRLAQREAGDLQRDMQKSDDQTPATPGREQMGRAAEEMRQAADRLGERSPGVARQNQEGALEQLQQALDELDDALRQVRREESEETLATLEVRFRSMLRREQQILEVLIALDEKGVENWTRLERLRLAESAETQAGVHEDCEGTLRILVDEGSTVIVPELVRQMADDMADVSTRLDRADASVQTQRVLGEIVALLEEVLGAIEQKRAEDTRQQKEGRSPDDGPQALLPGSAELKLLRWSQLQLNGRTLELAGAQDEPAEDRTRAMERLSQRQRRLAELARRMNERQ